jgi:hypothetical protein
MEVSRGIIRGGAMLLVNRDIYYRLASVIRDYLVAFPLKWNSNVLSVNGELSVLAGATFL